MVWDTHCRFVVTFCLLFCLIGFNLSNIQIFQLFFVQRYRCMCIFLYSFLICRKKLLPAGFFSRIKPVNQMSFTRFWWDEKYWSNTKVQIFAFKFVMLNVSLQDLSLLLTSLFSALDANCVIFVCPISVPYFLSTHLNHWHKESIAVNIAKIINFNSIHLA